MRSVRLQNAQEITGTVRNEDNFSIQLQSRDGSFHMLSKADLAAIEILPEPIMPTSYAATLTDSEFNDLVKFLITVARSERGSLRPPSDDEE
jgi:hypothetical protein